MNEYAHPEALVTTQWVNSNLGKPEIKLVEVDVDSESYKIGHIPGAIGLNWQTQLQDQVKRDILSKSQFEELLGNCGVSEKDTVILYGDCNNCFAAYGFWLFKIYGHRDVRLMDGGQEKWLNEPGKALTTEVMSIEPVRYTAQDPNRSIRARVQDVLQAVHLASENLVDVRSPEEFSGAVVAPVGVSETAQRGGHIPGAINIPWSRAVDPEGRFKSLAELKKIYVMNSAVNPLRPTIAYCRTGERASHTWFVLSYLLGFDNVKIYDGSWTEYGSMIALPIERPIRELVTTGP